MFDSFIRIAGDQLKAHARRRTSELLDSLPVDVQKDIGWRWAPRIREKARRTSWVSTDLLG